MTWIDLINNEINSMVKEIEKLIKRLDKIREDDSSANFDKKVSLMSEINALNKAIVKFHVLLGKGSQVDE